jgi:subtilisin family serine protease
MTTGPPVTLERYPIEGFALSPAVRLFVVAAFALALSATASASTDVIAPGRGAAHIALASSPAQYVPGEVIVRFRARASRAAERRADARVGARVTERFTAMRMQVAKTPAGLSVAAAIRRYEADPAVASAEPNYLRYPNLTPTDALFAQLWGLNNTAQSHPVTDHPAGDSTPTPHAGANDADIDAPEAWDVETGDSNTVIAVIDTGADVSHPDLAGQVWTNPGEVDDGLDNDGNNKIDDINGWDFANHDETLLSGNPFVGYDHGTHVSGTIAAALDNSTGVVGVCPGCRIMVLKVARDSDGQMALSSIIGALNYAKQKGAQIANMSYGGPQWSNNERNAIRTSGLLAVVSSGNDSLDNDMPLSVDIVGGPAPDIFSPSYPASYTLSNILTVAASNDEDRNGYSTECDDSGFTKSECAFTNWGHDSVDVSAPGVDITSTVPVAAPVDWETWDGTSMAAPHVSGVAGLVLSANPTYSVGEVKNAIMNSADRPANLDTLYIAPAQGITGPSGDIVIETGSPFTRTSGRVNALSALTGSTTNATPHTDGNVNGATSMSRAKVSGSVGWPKDINDVKKRKLSKGRTYRVTLTVPGGEDYDLWVWKPGTKEIWQFPKLQKFSATVGSSDEGLKFKAGSTGVYYLHVQAWVRSAGRYTLKIARVG